MPMEPPGESYIPMEPTLQKPVSLWKVAGIALAVGVLVGSILTLVICLVGLVV